MPFTCATLEDLWAYLVELHQQQRHLEPDRDVRHVRAHGCIRWLGHIFCIDDILKDYLYGELTVGSRRTGCITS